MRGARLVFGAVIAIAMVVAGIGLIGGHGVTVPTTLERPGPGEVRPDHLADGTPVWVIGHDDGSTDVLLGFDTHRPYGLGKMLWWCETAEALDDPHHGSKWDEYGVKLGGPAPTGLRSYDVRIEEDRVLVGSLGDPPPTSARARGPHEGDREWCGGDEAQVTYHRFVGWRVWDSPVEAVAADPDGWILLEGELIADPGQGRVYLCAPTGCEDRATAASVEVWPPGLELGTLGVGRFIAQVADGELVGVSRVIRLDPPGH